MSSHLLLTIIRKIFDDKGAQITSLQACMTYTASMFTSLNFVNTNELHAHCSFKFKFFNFYKYSIFFEKQILDVC